MITLFRLGNGERGCDKCQREANWQTLNQMPDALRKAIQSEWQRIDDTECILSGRPQYAPAASESA